MRTGLEYHKQLQTHSQCCCCFNLSLLLLSLSYQHWILNTNIVKHTFNKVFASSETQISRTFPEDVASNESGHFTLEDRDEVKEVNFLHFSGFLALILIERVIKSWKTILRFDFYLIQHINRYQGAFLNIICAFLTNLNITWKKIFDRRKVTSTHIMCCVEPKYFGNSRVDVFHSLEYFWC